MLAGVIRRYRSHLLAQDSGWGRMDPGLGRAGPFGSRLGLKVSSQPPFWAHQLAISLFLHPLQAKVPGTCLLTIRVLQAHGLPSKDLGECWAWGVSGFATSDPARVLGRDAGRLGVWGLLEGTERRQWMECQGQAPAS